MRQLNHGPWVGAPWIDPAPIWPAIMGDLGIRGEESGVQVDKGTQVSKKGPRCPGECWEGTKISM